MLDSTEILDISERIGMMRMQEDTTYSIRDYLADSVKIRKAASKPVDEDCRVKMCEWCYQVVDFCKFRRETVGIGMSALDRYLCTSAGRKALCNRKEYQLAAMTTLYIAIKIHEPLEMETSLLADLSRGCYNEMEFVEMEQQVLMALEWRVNGPTPLGFIQHFMALAPDTLHPDVVDVIFDYARFQTELAISEHAFVAIKPSEIALAAVLNAMEGLDTNIMPLKAQGKLVRNIERSTEIYVEDVQLTQAKLSLLLIGILSDKFADIVAETTQNSDEEEDFTGEGNSKTNKVRERNSPVSVVRR